MREAVLAIDKHHIAASKAMLGPDAELDVVEASTPEQAE